MAPTRKLAELFYEVRARSDGLQRDLKATETQFGKLSAFVKANPIAAVTALGTAVAGIAIKAARMASEVETSMKRVANSVPTGQLGLDKLRDAIEGVSRATGRTQAELAKDAEEIARQGAESAEAVAQRLQAAQIAADATGTDIKTVIGGLDQTLDLFNASSADAARALGTLFAAAKGRTSLDDLFAGLQAAAPAIGRLKLDIDTAARAIVALVEQGKTTKQAAAELNKLAAAGAAGREQITRLAESMAPVGNGLVDMQRSADEFNNSAERLTARLQGEFSAVMIDLGRRVLPLVNFTLRSIVETLDILSGRTAEVSKLQGTSALGVTVATAARASANGLKARTAEFVAAAVALNKLVVSGQGDIVATTAEQAERITKGVERLVQAGAVTEARVAPLLNFLDEVSKRPAPAPRQPLRAGGATGLSADDIAKETKAASEARREVEALAKQIGALGSVQDLATGKTQLSADAYKKLKAELTAAAVEFPQFAAHVGLMTERLDELRQAAAGFEGAELRREIEGLLAAMTTTAVDDLEIALRELQARLKERGATDEQVAQITALEEAFIKVKAQSEALDAALENGRQGGITPLREMVNLLDELQRAERELQELESKGPEHDRERKELLEQIVKLKQRIKELEEQTAEKTKKVEEATGKLAKKLSDASDIAYGLSVILLGSEATLTKMIAAVGRIADGFEDIADMGGFGEIFKDAESLAAALPALGQIIGGGIALGKLIFEDPNAEANRRATEINTQALQKLTDRVGDLAGVGTPGNTIAAIRSATAGVNTNQGGVLGPIAVLADWVKALQRAGVSMAEATEFAKQLGFDLSRFTVEGFKAFQKGLRELDFSVFFDTFAGQLDRINADFEIHGITDPIDQLVRRAELLARIAPSFAAIFDGLDLTTLAGRTAAVERLREQWDRFMANPEEFEKALEASGLSLDEWKQQMLETAKVLGDAAIAAARFNEAMSDLELDLEIAGIDDPVARARGVVGAAAATDERFAPLLGFDLSSAAGRAEAEQFLQALSVGADDELKETIVAILRAIRAVPKEIVGEQEKQPGEVEIVGNAARGMTEVTGNRIADFFRTGLILDRERNEILQDILGAVVGVPAVPLVQPPSFSASLGRVPVAGATNVSLVVSRDAIQISAPPGVVTDQQGFQRFLAGELPRAFIRKVSEGLAEEATFTDKTLGRVRVTA